MLNNRSLIEFENWHYNVYVLLRNTTAWCWIGANINWWDSFTLFNWERVLILITGVENYITKMLPPYGPLFTLYSNSYQNCIEFRNSVTFSSSSVELSYLCLFDYFYCISWRNYSKSIRKVKSARQTKVIEISDSGNRHAKKIRRNSSTPTARELQVKYLTGINNRLQTRN